MRKEICIALALASMLMVPIGLADDITMSATVSSSMSAVFQYAAVSFGSLTQGTSNNAAPNQASGVYNVTVTTNANWKVSASGTDLDDGGGHTFSIGNLTMDTNSTAGNLAVGSGVALTGAPQIIDTGYTPVTSTANYNGFWLSIPSGQYAAAYSSTVTITYANV